MTRMAQEIEAYGAYLNASYSPFDDPDEQRCFDEDLLKARACDGSRVAGAEGDHNQAMSAEDMLRDLEARFEPLRGGWGGVPDPVRIHRKADGWAVLVITRNRWEMEPQFFMAPSVAAVICKAWNAFKS